MPVDISFREMEQDFAGNIRSVVKGDMTTEDFTKFMMYTQNQCLLENSPFKGRMWGAHKMSRYTLSDILEDVRKNNKDFFADFKAIFKYPDRIEEDQMQQVITTLISKYSADAGPAPQARGEGGAGAGPASMDSKELDSALAKATTAKVRAELRMAELMEELVAARIARDEAQKVLDDLNSRKRKRD